MLAINWWADVIQSESKRCIFALDLKRIRQKFSEFDFENLIPLLFFIIHFPSNYIRNSIDALVFKDQRMTSILCNFEYNLKHGCPSFK